MERFVRRVQDKIVETLTSSVFGETRASKEPDRESEKAGEESPEQQEEKSTSGNVKENNEVCDTEICVVRRNDNDREKLFVDSAEDEVPDANNDSIEDGKCHVKSRSIHGGSSKQKHIFLEADKKLIKMHKVIHNNSKMEEEEKDAADEDEVQEEEEEEEEEEEKEDEEEEDHASNSMTLMGLYTEYEKSVKLEENKIRNLEDSIFLGNLVEHYVGLLGMIQNVEDEFAKRIKKGELSRSNVISNIRRGMKRNMVEEGRIQKVSNDDGSAYLNKKYQKLYIAHSLLENDYDELYEKYESLKIDHEDLQSLQNMPKTGPESNMTRAGFKGKGFKIGRKLVSYNSDR